MILAWSVRCLAAPLLWGVSCSAFQPRRTHRTGLSSDDPIVADDRRVTLSEKYETPIQVPMTDSIRLVLIDQPTLLRRSVVAYLQRRRGLCVVADSGSGALGLGLARSHIPNVVIVEPDVPEGGRDLIVELCRAIPNGVVIVLTDSSASASGTSISEALHAGARAYLDKGCAPEDLVRAVQRAVAGEVLVAANPKAVAPDVNAAASTNAAASLLTNREREVVQLVATGFTNAEVARSLSITEHTAKGHLAQILRKLGLANRVQLATFALQQGLGAHDGVPIDELASQSLRVPNSG